MLKKLCLIPTERSPQKHDLSRKLGALLGRPERVETVRTARTVPYQMLGTSASVPHGYYEASTVASAAADSSSSIYVTSIGETFTPRERPTTPLISAIDTRIVPYLSGGTRIFCSIEVPDNPFLTEYRSSEEVRRDLQDAVDLSIVQEFIARLSRIIRGDRAVEQLSEDWIAIGSDSEYSKMSATNQTRMRETNIFNFNAHMPLVVLPVEGPLIAVSNLGTLTRTQPTIAPVRSPGMQNTTYVMEVHIMFDLSNIEAYTLQY